MADNYLENRMEEHRRQQSGGVSPRRSGMSLPRGCVALDTGGATVLVKGFSVDPVLAEAVVRCYGAAGARPAFSDTDLNRGRALAQTAAARHYPMDDAAAEASFAPDVTVDIIIGGEIVLSRGGRTVRMSVGRELTPSNRRWLLLLLTAEAWALVPDLVQTV